MTKKPNPRPTKAKTKTPRTPTLRFSPTAWAKLLFLRDYGDTEVGGFGVSANDDPLFVEDLQLVQQTCSWVHVAFDDESVADYFDRQVDAGRRPDQFARIWVHTHPGDSPRPSATDEDTFARVFGRADWAIMFILAQEGQTYARLRFNVGPRADVELPVSVDYSSSFAGSDPDAWEREYLTNVHPQQTLRRSVSQFRPFHASLFDPEPTDAWCDDWFDEDIDHDESQPRGSNP